MADKQLVSAVFPDEIAADKAAVALKDSGITDGDAVGILVLDADGELKQDKFGARSTGKGAAIGGVLLLLGPAAPGVGMIGGAAAGALHHKSLGLSDAHKARLATELTAGKAAVGVLAEFDTAPVTSNRLTELGGVSEVHKLSDGAARGRGNGALDGAIDKAALGSIDPAARRPGCTARPPRRDGGLATYDEPDYLVSRLTVASSCRQTEVLHAVD
jgi:uncharacterized membrane protein